MTEDIFYRNQPASKDKAAVFAPAKRCIYCLDAEPPFTREHVIPRGMGGGMILLEASCSDCQKIINEIETYCMRGPFLSHRLATGLINHPDDLGATIKMPIEAAHFRSVLIHSCTGLQGLLFRSRNI